jgi:hypothetical protein
VSLNTSIKLLRSCLTIQEDEKEHVDEDDEKEEE